MGKYIIVEGHDGTGKSTQVDILAEYLRQRNHEVVQIEEPGSDNLEKSTPVANYLRRIIKNDTIKRDPEINVALFSAARRELYQQKIQPALERGACVLSSRNYLSTLAYQGAGDGVDEAHILQITELFTGPEYMSPDQTVILTLSDAKERQRRIDTRGELETPDTFENKDESFQQRVDQAYVDLAKRYDIPTIDCIVNGHSKSIEEIQTELRNLLSLD